MGDRAAGGVAWRDEELQNERLSSLHVDSMAVVALPACQNKSGQRETHKQKETNVPATDSAKQSLRARDRGMHYCHSPAPVCRTSLTTNQRSASRGPG